MLRKQVYFAGGCFWGVERYFSLVSGVVETNVGYANGTVVDPSYGDVCKGETGHAEVVKITYDPNKISLTFLLQLFYDIIDPTLINRQGNDVGTQYRTGIYYVDCEDEQIIKDSLKWLQTSYKEPIVVEVERLNTYFKGEEYHQKYLEKNPTGYCHINVSKFGEAKRAKDTAKNN